MLNTKKVKVRLHTHCLAIIEEKISSIQAAILSIEESRNNETKSSAGDKYETGRAMLHMEEEKSKTQLAKTNQLRLILQTINPVDQFHEAVLGSLVKSSSGNYFISAPLGKVELESDTYYCISLASPIGQQLKGKKAGDSFSFGNRETTILEIL